jgi:hypothetical protein
VADELEVGLATVARVRQRFVEQGLEAALAPKPTARAYARKLDGAAEARLVALACSAPARGAQPLDAAAVGRPDGRARARRRAAVVRDRAPRVKKNELKPWLRQMWCIPPGQDCQFVAAMEDVLEVYHRPHDPTRPVVCLDETSKQLIGEIRAPLAARPGEPSRYDCEYVRNGTANLFVAFEPLAGWRHAEVTDTRTRRDFAWFVKGLLDGRYRDADKVVLVMDQLNTHSTASLYEAFAPEEARRLAERLEVHHTPKHGSWLNMAEIELSVLGRQCLDARIEDKPTLASEVAAWEAVRNDAKARVVWRFTTADARVKLKRLYPSVQV